MIISTTVPYFTFTITLLLCCLGFVFPKNKFLFLIQSVWILILTCLNTGSGDWIGNEGYYWESSTNQISPLNFTYILVSHLFKSFNLDFIAFNATFCLLATIFILFTILRFTKNCNMVISLWYIYPFIDNIVQKRAYYALGLIIVAMPLLFKTDLKLKNVIWFELITFIACQIHSMYFLYLTLPLFLMLNYKSQKIIAIFGLVIGFVLKNQIQVLVNSVFGNAMSSKSDLYFNTLAATASVSHTIFWAIWQLSQLALVLYINKNFNDNNFNKKLLSMNLWGILLIPLYSFNPVFTRAFRVILLFNYITVANSCELKQNRYISLKTLGIISIELIFALASFYMFDINNDGLRQMIYPIFQNNILLN
ncbi:EpsG family protein [Limosilactobacillus reuteri]|uniref:EpsG family protein n=1 Tax=Limosilactobacillus reuteri TaxID=1598 RepID=UPI003D01E269